MNRRMMTFAAIGAVVALSTPAWAQTAGSTASPGSALGSAQGSAASNLAAYGTKTPIVAGAGNSDGVEAAMGGSGVPVSAASVAGIQPGVSSPGITGTQFGVSSPASILQGNSGLATGLTATTGAGTGTPPMAGNTAAQANAATTGTAASTGMTLACAPISAAVGVLPAQMPGNC